MKPSEVAHLSLDRLAFMLGLDMTAMDTAPDAAPDQDRVRYRARCCFADRPQSPFELEFAANDLQDRPCIEFLVRRLDLTRAPQADILEQLNRLNRRGACCAASFDTDTGCIEVRTNICFIGYQTDPALDTDRRLAQCEATLNLLVQLFDVAERTLQDEY